MFAVFTDMALQSSIQLGAQDMCPIEYVDTSASESQERSAWSAAWTWAPTDCGVLLPCIMACSMGSSDVAPTLGDTTLDQPIATPFVRVSAAIDWIRGFSFARYDAGTSLASGR